MLGLFQYIRNDALRTKSQSALYSDHDVILLDDPLSAVDVHVGEHIFQHALCGDLVGKTVVLVTHQLQYLSACDQVMYVEAGSVHVDTHANLKLHNKQYQFLLQHHHRDEGESTGEGTVESTVEDAGEDAAESTVENAPEKTLQDEPAPPAAGGKNRFQTLRHKMSSGADATPDKAAALGDANAAGSVLLKVKPSSLNMCC